MKEKLKSYQYNVIVRLYDGSEYSGYVWVNEKVGSVTAQFNSGCITLFIPEHKEERAIIINKDSIDTIEITGVQEVG